MPQRFHLLILALGLIALITIIGSSAKESAPTTIPTPVDNTYSITIIRASWGLNCAQTKTAQTSNYADVQARLQENNVLSKVSELCNGKSECAIPINTANLGTDPIPECFSKELVVEYRCFSYDRPWLAKSMGNSLVIKCNKPVS